MVTKDNLNRWVPFSANMSSSRRAHTKFFNFTSYMTKYLPYFTVELLEISAIILTFIAFKIIQKLFRVHNLNFINMDDRFGHVETVFDQ